MDLRDLFNFNRDRVTNDHQPASENLGREEIGDTATRELREKTREAIKELHDPHREKRAKEEIGDALSSLLARTQGALFVPLALELNEEVGTSVLNILRDKIKEELPTRLLEGEEPIKDPGLLATDMLRAEKARVLRACSTGEDVLATFPHLKETLNEAITRVSFGKSTFNVRDWAEKVRYHLVEYTKPSEFHSFKDLSEKLMERLVREEVATPLELSLAADELDHYVWKEISHRLGTGAERHLLASEVIHVDPLQMAADITVQEIGNARDTIANDDLLASYPSLPQVLARAEIKLNNYLKEADETLEWLKGKEPHRDMTAFCEDVLAVFAAAGHSKITLAASRDEIEKAILTSLIESIQDNLKKRLEASGTVERDPKSAALDIFHMDLRALTRSVPSVDELSARFPEIDGILEKNKGSDAHFVQKVSGELEHLKNRAHWLLFYDYAGDIVNLLEATHRSHSLNRGAIERTVISSIIENVQESLEERLGKARTLSSDPYVMGYGVVREEVRECQRKVKSVEDALARHPKLRSLVPSRHA